MDNFKRIIFNIYTKFSTFFENQFYNINSVDIDNNSNLKKFGYSRFKLNKGITNCLNLNKTIEKNKYFKIFILDKKSIDKIINNIFLENDLLNKLTDLTGFNYKVSFLIAYETASIPDQYKNEQIYANHWHFDKPYSQNTLKLIMPIEKIGKNSGAMKILNIENSNKLNLKNSNFDTSEFEFIGDEKDIFAFYPNLCAHKAGIPKPNFKRKQLMLQLNPSKKWSYSKSLLNKQYGLEPKFPLKDTFESTALIK